MMKRLIDMRIVCFLGMMGIMLTSHAQENWKSVDHRQFVFAKALVKYGAYQDDYAEAKGVYEKLYPKDTSFAELQYEMGLCLFMMDKKDKEAHEWLKRAHANNVPEAQFYLGQIAHINEKFNEAITYYTAYKSFEDKPHTDDEVNYYLNISRRAKKAVASPIDVSITNLGSKVNTPHHEYVPLVTADGRHLFFTSRRPGTTGNKRDPNGEYYEDIYAAELKNGTWQSVKNLGKPLNTEMHDATVGMSSNGNTLLVYRTNENLTGGDLYMSELGSVDNWLTPRKLDSKINSDHQEPSACLSNNGMILYFSSNRPGGFGGKDLYYSRKLPLGGWGVPVNLGSNVNTPYDEDAPFLAPSGRTLYFSSTGHSTIGGYDIFRSHLDINSKWGVAENLGYPMNTVEDDLYFSLAADGKSGYYSSDKPGGYGKQDIYKVELLFDHPRPAIIKGTIKGKDGKPVKATITLTNVDNKKVHGIYKSNNATGKYLLILDPDTRYQMVVEAAGHHSHVDYVEYELGAPGEEHKLEVKLKSLEN